MSNHDGFDVVEVELTRMAGALLESAQELLSAAAAFQSLASPRLGAFGNLPASFEVGAACGEAAPAAYYAVGAVATVLEVDTEKLYRTAFNYQDAERENKSNADKVWGWIPG